MYTGKHYCIECGETTAHKVIKIIEINLKVIYKKTCQVCGTEEGIKIPLAEWVVLQGKWGS